MYAYGLPDYPGRRGGEGLFVDLYADAELTDPVGRLWTNDTSVGLLHIEDEDDLLYTIAALRLRRFHRRGVRPHEAVRQTGAAMAHGTGPSRRPRGHRRHQHRGQRGHLAIRQAVIESCSWCDDEGTVEGLRGPQPCGHEHPYDAG
jgi:hypothetical protein